VLVEEVVVVVVVVVLVVTLVVVGVVLTPVFGLAVVLGFVGILVDVEFLVVIVVIVTLAKERDVFTRVTGG